MNKVTAAGWASAANIAARGSTGCLDIRRVAPAQGTWGCGLAPGNKRAEIPAVVSPRSVCRVLPGPKQTRGSCSPSRGSPQEQLRLQTAGGALGGLGGRDGDGEVSRKFVQTQDKRGPSEAPDTAGRTSPREQPPKMLTWEHLFPPDLILALGVLAQGLPVARHSRVPWRQLFRKPSIW